MEEMQLLDKIIRRLNVLIVLEMDKSAGAEGICLADKIVRLRELELMPAEIADIVRKPINYITATLSKRKTKALKEK